MPVDGERGSTGSRCGLQHLSRPCLLCGRGLKTGVHDGNLPRVYAQLAAETKTTATQGVGAERVAIVQRSVDSVDGSTNTGPPGSHHQLSAVRQQIGMFGREPEVELEVDRSKDEALYACRAGDRLTIRQTGGGLDHGQQRHSGTGAGGRKVRIDPFGFREHDPRDARQSRQQQVVAKPGSLDSVDAYDHRVVIAQPGREATTRRVLLRGRHGVLEVDDHGIGP